MRPGNNIPAAINYAGTGETRKRNTDQVDGNTTGPGRSKPKVLVELVTVDGPEGQKLHTIQAEVIHRVLARLAERQTQTPQKESRL